MSRLDPGVPGGAAPAPSRRMGRAWRFGVLLLILAAIATGVSGWRAPRTALPDVVAVERRDLEISVMATGRLRPRDFVDVGAQVSGQLSRLHVAIGDRVAESDLLAEVDAEVEAAEVEALRAERSGLEAELAEQQAELAFAEAEHRRSETLEQSAILSRTAADASRRDLAKGRARVDQIRARIAQATATLAAREAALRRAAIRAPIAGTIVAIEAREGQTLNANYDTPMILTIADLDTMTVWTEVSEADVGRLRPGMPVWFTTLGAPGVRHRSTLRQVLPIPARAPGESDTGSMPLEAKAIVYLALFDIPNPDRTLLGGMTAQVFFVEASAEGVLTVPVGALAADGTVRVRRPDGSVETRAIETGLATRFHAEVTRGLAEGEEVVAGDATPPVPGLVRIEP